MKIHLLCYTKVNFCELAIITGMMRSRSTATILLGLLCLFAFGGRAEMRPGILIEMPAGNELKYPKTWTFHEARETTSSRPFHSKQRRVISAN